MSNWNIENVENLTIHTGCGLHKALAERGPLVQDMTAEAVGRVRIRVDKRTGVLRITRMSPLERAWIGLRDSIAWLTGRG